MPNRENKLTPEQLLGIANKDDQYRKRGRLKVFVGFAAGVGKTFEMLQEANRRKHRSHQDVVIGFVETHGREGTAEQLGDLEIIPRKKMEYRGAVLEEMDLEAVTEQHPQWCVVDELAHTNVPGSKNEKRWQDVYEILDAGINVLSTFNIQHLESLNDKIYDITGIRVRETLPDRVMQEADEVVDVDVSPRALRHRIERGEVYKPEKAEQALDNFFREDNLIALREICLRELAGRIEHDFEQTRPLYSSEKMPTIEERVLICIAPGTRASRIIRRGYHLAKRMGGEVAALYIKRPNQPTDEAAMDALETFLHLMGIPFTILEGDPAEEIAHYAIQSKSTQLVMGHMPAQGLQALFKKSVLHTLLRTIPEIDITVVGEPLDARNGKC